MNMSAPEPPATTDAPSWAPRPGHSSGTLTRRAFVGAVTATGALLSVGWPHAVDASDHRRAPRGPGSVSGAPSLPPGFRDVFTSRSIDTGDVRLHAVTGGHGTPLLLIHGWPQTWFAWRLVMPALAEHHQVVAVDQRGIGLSDKPADGYDTATLAADMVATMDALGHDRFAVYGTDVGMPIAYALAADHRDRVDRLAVSEAFLPGIAAGTALAPLLLRDPLFNARLWHLAFNQLPAEVNEALVRGREDVFFGAELDSSAGTKKLPPEVVDYYVHMLRADRDALRGSFGFYRALWTSADQNVERQKVNLTVPVLAMGGAESAKDGIGAVMALVADNVRAVTINGAAHWVAEQAPAQIVTTLETFLAS
jgi:pimeloyl-ACP methyl ester carboxylesterase